MNDRLPYLREKARRLPLLPGVYIMHDSSDKIIYIGKAKQLKNRVSQYFGSGSQHTDKVRAMVENVHDFEYIITDSEYEALVLECSLIKQHTPKYNILLKDDKGYHYIRISQGKWKRITESKQIYDDGARYIGPYISGFVVKQAVDEVNKLFQLSTCNRKFPQEFGKGRPCLNYYIKQCCAPCRGKISEELYDSYVEEAVDYLKGKKSVSVDALTAQMNTAAENLEFEKAARLRDRIAALNKITEKQKVVASKIEEQDVFAFAGLEDSVCAQVFRYSSGRLYDRESYMLDEQPDDMPTLRKDFLMAYYSLNRTPPARITLDGAAEDNGLLEQWLSSKAGHRVKITVPQKGEQYRLVQMCLSNAAEALAQEKNRTGRETAALEELGNLLGLNKAPSYIESYDISNTAGNDNVAGMVVFFNGRPLKEAYRRFSIKTVVGQDDYGSMREVITRRIERYFEQKESGTGFGRLPDLILLDGGRGHVSAIEPILQKYGLDIPLFGMVKDDKHRTRAIATNGGEISITSSRAAFTLISTIQEEVHRFAISYHKQKRSHTSLSSQLEKIKGIGPKKAQNLLSHFGSVKKIEQADERSLMEVKGISKTDAQNIIEYFNE